jgi:ligand-binding SRPBCC domain-containing protein
VARFELVTEIKAEPERCFDLSRDLDLHKRAFNHTGEEAIGGRTSGLIEFGEQVTWRARHFGMIHFHTSLITRYDRSQHFRDEMTEGRFKMFRHDHYFEATDNGTRMTDIVEFRSPFGLLGAIMDFLLLKRYMRNLILARNETIREEAERC